MDKPVSSLILDVHTGESVRIGNEHIEVQVVQKSGQLARLKITAPREIRIEKVARPPAMRG